MNELIAIFLVALAGGVALFSRSAGASFPSFSAVPAINDREVDVLARTIWGEARGDDGTGMHAVANVIMNRFAKAQQSNAKGRQFGRSVSEIVQKPFQFSAWNANDPNFAKMLAVTTDDAEFQVAIAIAQLALEGQLTDITGGADHYHTAAVNPFWSKGLEPVAVIRSHKFFNLA